MQSGNSSFRPQRTETSLAYETERAQCAARRVSWLLKRDLSAVVDHIEVGLEGIVTLKNCLVMFNWRA